MKTSTKLMLAAALLSVGFANTASADVDVYLTGSSAYRAAVTNAIGHLLTSPAAAFVSTTTGLGTGGAVAGSGQQLITGQPNATGIADGMTSGTTYWFHTSWSGSVAGITVLVYGVNTAAKFLPDSETTLAMTVGSGAAGSTADGGNGVPSTDATVSRTADGAFSDVFQASTKYTSPALIGANSGFGSGVIGVVPFVFVANPDATAFVGATGGKITNIGSTQAKSLYGGFQYLGQFTGNDSDAGYVLPVGRNFDSGTRVTTLAETGFNPIHIGAATQQPTQYEVVKTTSGSTTTAVKVDLYPGETLFSGTPAAATFNSGNSGYSSGGSEAGALEVSGTSNTALNTGATSPAYMIGSLGESDASNAVKLGCSYLSYDGVAYGSISGTTTSYNRTLLDEGVYTLWGYEHFYYPSGNGNATVMDAVAKEVTTVDAPIAGEKVSNMAVQRAYEGGPISYVGVGGTSGL